MAKSVSFKMVEHEPGGFKIPTKAKNSGTLTSMWRRAATPSTTTGQREKLGGSMAGWTVVTEPVARSEGRHSRPGVDESAHQARPRRDVSSCWARARPTSTGSWRDAPGARRPGGANHPGRCRQVGGPVVGGTRQGDDDQGALRQQGRHPKGGARRGPAVVARAGQDQDPLGEPSPR